ncbi:L,D-transpeptidase family protein [Polluticoccus soli]|uniref:L,D-transpeptidase family protein n=1 Tax=Polluticoccus soli TaxID=3034150 RepID=UPI0023E0F5CA|nr:L,D-transpeptidase family protein [Flavipsychrobacter sp. JY13-12]
MNTSTNRRTVGKILSLFALFVAIAFTSCRERRDTAGGLFGPTKFDEDDFVAVLSKKYVKPIDSASWNKEKLHEDIEQYQQYVYQANDYFPLWLDEDGSTKYVDELIKELENLRMDGLDPEQYNLSFLKQQRTYFDRTKTPNLDTVVAFDTACTHSYLAASHDLLFGRISAKKADPIWYHKNDSTWRPDTVLIKQLYQQGRYPTLASYRSKIPMYNVLMETRAHYDLLLKNQEFLNAKAGLVADTVPVDSYSMYIIHTEMPWLANAETDSGNTRSAQIKAYQKFYALKQSGKLDKETMAKIKGEPTDVFDHIDVNMERLRWLPQSFEDRYVIVNVPMMELFLRKDGEDVMHMNVVVGRPERKTPSIGANMANVVFNPSWGVPPTILRKDVAPGLAKSGAAYLAERRLVPYTKKGKRVNPASVTAANATNFMFRQPPGDHNALGNVKFNLPNNWDIYLHDTPHREDFDKPYRAKSSGCIRVQKPREMAEYILSVLEGKQYDQERISAVISTQSTKFVNLEKKLAVHIVYLTVFDSDNQRVRFVKDIYEKDAQVLSQLRGDTEQPKETVAKK